GTAGSTVGDGTRPSGGPLSREDTRPSLSAIIGFRSLSLGERNRRSDRRRRGGRAAARRGATAGGHPTWRSDARSRSNRAQRGGRSGRVVRPESEWDQRWSRPIPRGPAVRHGAEGGGAGHRPLVVTSAQRISIVSSDNLPSTRTIGREGSKGAAASGRRSAS